MQDTTKRSQGGSSTRASTPSRWGDERESWLEVEGAPTKKQRTEANGTSDAELLKRIKELESERDMWKARAEDGMKQRFPATHWPAEKPSLQPLGEYPHYDRAKPKESFLAVCDMLIDEACKELPQGYEMPEAEVAWVRRMLTYNVRGGKMNRGLMVVESGILILESKGLPITNKVVVQLAILGWCIEWLQGWLLIADDIMDESHTRRGQKCWYLVEDVKNIAYNDAFMTEMLVYKALKRHFSSEPYYLQLLDLFLETTFQTECGQLLDTMCMNLKLADFTVDRWTLIVKYKTAFYSFYASVALGMMIAGISDMEEYNACREILMIMGIYFQAQDDYLDCYATPEQLGKIGTDIQDQKCGWLFVHAYHSLANAEQKEVFDKLYGKCKVQTPEEQKIKDLYTELGLKDMYEKYEADSYAKIMTLKGTVKQVPWSVFDAFLKKIYKRGK
jgi:farnesyl diphosphate synthase